MPRYLTFDQKTASALRRQIPEDRVFEHGASGAVEYALGTDRTLVTVLPSQAGRETAVAVFRWPKHAQEPVSPVTAKKPVASAQPPVQQGAITRASGFLGLSDDAIFEDDKPAAPRKQSWWRKFWPEDE